MHDCRENSVSNRWEGKMNIWNTHTQREREILAIMPGKEINWKFKMCIKYPLTFRPLIYKLSIQAYYQTINVWNMNKSK